MPSVAAGRGPRPERSRRSRRRRATALDALGPGVAGPPARSSAASRPTPSAPTGATCAATGRSSTAAGSPTPRPSREPDVAAFLAGLREGGDDAPAAVGLVGRADPGRGPRASTGSWRSRARPAPTRPAPSGRPGRRSGCPRRSASPTSSGCWRRPRSATPRRRCATAPCWRCSTARARGSPRRSASTSTTSTSRTAGGLSGCSARAARSASSRSGRFAREAVAAYLVRARPTFAAAGRRHPGALPQPARRAAVPAERLDA